MVLKLLVGEVEHSFHPLLETISTQSLLIGEPLKHLPVGGLHSIGESFDENFEMTDIFSPFVIISNCKDRYE
jgi:hypothetical protein